MTEQYWTYIRDGETYDAEFADKQAASKYANDLFEEEMADAGEAGGEEEIELICFEYDDDGEMVIKEKHQGFVCYTFYQGDYAEQNVWYAGGGGVL